MLTTTFPFIKSFQISGPTSHTNKSNSSISNKIIINWVTTTTTTTTTNRRQSLIKFQLHPLLYQILLPPSKPFSARCRHSTSSTCCCIINSVPLPSSAADDAKVPFLC